MRFKLDKHDKEKVKCLISDIYCGLKNYKHFNKIGRNWDLRYVPTYTQVYKFQERVEQFKKSIERGDIFPPIVIVDNNIIDGRHKAAALHELGYKYMPCAVATIGKDSVVEKDEVYAPLIDYRPDKLYNTAGIKKCGKIYCINCAHLMTQRRFWLFCENCGNETFYEEVLGWTVVNGEIK